MDLQDSKMYFKKRKPEGRIITGIFLFLIGLALLINELTNRILPHWLFTWPMILIVAGIFSGIRNRFRNPGWVFPLLIGLFFLSSEMGLVPNVQRYLIPLFIISAGLILVTQPRRGRHRKFYEQEYFKNQSGETIKGPFEPKPFENYEPTEAGTEEDYFHSTSIFGGTKKVILSKSFRGADITCIFGGCEIDLSHSDLKENAEIHITFIFGGGKIIIPSDWQVKSNIVPIFGGVEDKRNPNISQSNSKVLILDGVCVFGGLEIQNFVESRNSGLDF